CLFFQAEDGIRDRNVTGVQTCALPIFPVGQTLSYSEVAERLGKPKAVRAVANACAANPLALVIPCHRILRADGGISGYRWGVERSEERRVGKECGAEGGGDGDEQGGRR